LASSAIWHLEFETCHRQ